MDNFMNLWPFIRFRRPTGILNMELIDLSDASHGASESLYWKFGSFTASSVYCMGKRKSIYYILRQAHMQKRITYYTFGAKVLVVPDSNDKVCYIKSSLKPIFPDR